MIVRRSLAWVGIPLLAAATALGATAFQDASADSPRESTSAAVTARAPAAVLGGLADAAEHAVPSVVNLATTRTRKVGAAEGQIPGFDEMDPTFRQFFGPDGPRAPRDQQERGVGSGVIVSADGLILTNAHVVDGADRVEITLHDGREVDGTVIGADKRSDLAVVRIDKKDAAGLVPLPMGDSSKLRLGEVVLAIGNPFGVGQTVTMGIVSGTGRSALGIVDYEDFIQTDAAINPGNSGGALINTRGELVGVNTAILSRSGGSQGIGFAIPTSMIQPIMASLVKNGRVVRGFIGVAIQPVDRDMADAMGLRAGEGVLVGDVEAGGPAARAGIARGDVIRSINGRKLTSPAQLRNAVAALAPGTTARVDVSRGGSTRTADIVLGTLPDSDAADRPERQNRRGDGRGRDSTVESEGALLGGATLGELSPSRRQRLDVPSDVRAGALVERVEPGSAAESLGLQPGDVIIEVNRRPVRSPADVRALARNLGHSAAVLVVREGRTMYLAARK